MKNRTAWNKGMKGLKPWMNISGLNRGTPWNKGKHFSAESKLKMSISHKKRTSSKDYIHPMLGKKHSEETKQHWRDIRKGIDFRSKETIERVRKEWSKNRGDKNPQWKGGKSPVPRIVRTMPEYYEWRKKNYIRDDYTCQICGDRGGKLEVDHIVPFSFILEVECIIDRYTARKCEFLWDIENGRTLCVECHHESPSAQVRKLMIIKHYLIRELKTYG